MNKCMICLEYTNKDTKSIHLDCGHIFHSKCMKKFLKKNYYNKKTCPLCRELIGESCDYIQEFANDIYDMFDKKI